MKAENIEIAKDLFKRKNYFEGVKDSLIELKHSIDTEIEISSPLCDIRVSFSSAHVWDDLNEEFLKSYLELANNNLKSIDQQIKEL